LHFFTLIFLDLFKENRRIPQNQRNDYQGRNYDKPSGKIAAVQIHFLQSISDKGKSFFAELHKVNGFYRFILP